MRYLIFSLVLALSSISSAVAIDYRVTGVGEQTKAAVISFKTELEAQNTGINLDYLEDLATPRELTALLDNGVVDIAVVRFENIPTLMGSPLLRPFLARNAVKLRQAADGFTGFRQCFLTAIKQYSEFGIPVFDGFSESVNKLLYAFNHGLPQ